MASDNQVRVRIDPHLLQPLIEVAARNGMDVQELMRAATRHLILTSADCSTTGSIGRESKDVQAIVDEEIMKLHRGGVRKKGKDELIWIQEKIEDARARVTERLGAGQRYYVLIGGRALGPHRLDKLREWFALAVLSGDTQVKGAKTGATSAIKAIPKFNDYPPVLKRKLEELKKKEEPAWSNLKATEAQIRCLDFFEVPYVKKGLTRGRASLLITHFGFLDPKKEELYRASV